MSIAQSAREARAGAQTELDTTGGLRRASAG